MTLTLSGAGGVRMLQQRDRVRQAIALGIVRRPAWSMPARRRGAWRGCRPASFSAPAPSPCIAITRARLICAGMKSGCSCVMAVKVLRASAASRLDSCSSPLKVVDDRRIALGGLDLGQRVGGLVHVAGRQRGEEQRLADRRQLGRELQRMLQVAHRRTRLAHAHAHGGKPRLHADVVRRQRLGLLERLHRVLGAAGRGVGATEQIVGLGVGLARLRRSCPACRSPGPGRRLANWMRARTL